MFENARVQKYKKDFRKILILCTIFTGLLFYFNFTSKEETFLKEIREKYLERISYKYNGVSEIPQNPSKLSPGMKDILEKLIMKNKTEEFGFYIECGAVDGVFWSNTLILDNYYGWEGLLIEPNPRLFQKLKKSKRNAFISNVCISSKPDKLEYLDFRGRWDKLNIGHGAVSENSEKPKDYYLGEYNSLGAINCIPLHYLLMALKVTKVDFFSLDVEGHEYKILSGIPFDKIDIRILVVEHNLIPEGLDALNILMESKGYFVKYQDKYDVLYIKNGN